MKVDDEVFYINNEGTVSDEVCILIEIKKDCYRIKRPNGEMIRIFPDRVMPKEESCTMETNEFDPFADLPNGYEVWVKSNDFNDSVICRTYAIIDPNGAEYRSINTYNGKAHKVMSYVMKDYAALINRLQKRGYKKQNKY